MKNGVIKNVAIPVIVAEIAAFVFLIIFSFLSYGSSEPDMLAGILGFTCKYLSAIICGILSGFMNKQNQIRLGVAASLLFTALQITLTLSLSDNTKADAILFIRGAITFAIVLTISLLISTQSRSRRKRRLKRKLRR